MPEAPQNGAGALRKFVFRQREFLRKLPLEWQRYKAIRAFAAEEIPALAVARARQESAYRTFDNPLVSVVVATYNRGKLLVERTIPSVFEQTYQNFEIVVVGDCCPDDTPERVKQITDPRFKFVNLPERGKYPDDPHKRWLVAGVTPANHALDLAKGKWIAYLDDDDTLTPNSLEERLEFAYQANCELVHGRMSSERAPGEWEEGGSSQWPTGNYPFPKGGIPHSVVMYRSYLRLFKYDINSWKYDRAADNWLWHRMARAGVRTAYLPRVVCRQPLRPNETQRSAEALRQVLAAQQAA